MPADGDPLDARDKLARTAPGALVQAVSEGVLNNERLAAALAAQTANAQTGGRLLAKKADVDLLLRLAGTTQISRAVSAVGARKGEPFVLVIIGRRESVRRAEEAVSGVGRRLRRRSFTKSDLERIEAAALLNVGLG